ncbi:MAG: crosslink repair DNA glycosylase YcaQ family protein [Pseudomonadota bacterium]
MSAPPTGALNLDRLISQLGFIQLDSIQVVSRAHHHILWSRNQSYREPMLDRHLRRDRGVFEHFTHDASVIPMSFYPMWRRQFRRLGDKVRARGWDGLQTEGVDLGAIKHRISEEGPLCTRDFSSKVDSNKHMWSRPPHKLALDYLWYCGELTTAYRDNFTKFYDLTERVIPSEQLNSLRSEHDQIHWLCEAAVDRLAFATPGEIQRFWAAVDRREVEAWIKSERESLIPVSVECADKTERKAWASHSVLNRLGETASAPSQRLRVLNPFDPLIRDRQRLKYLFDFEYTVEMFVPAAKRRWGYYIYPILQGDRFIGRIELKAHRKQGSLDVLNLWSERSIRWSSDREGKLQAELERMARFIGVPEVRWKCARAPEAP